MKVWEGKNRSLEATIASQATEVCEETIKPSQGEMVLKLCPLSKWHEHLTL